MKIGDQVYYAGDLPEEDCEGTGEVIAVIADASGDEILTIEFDCGLIQDIPATELHLQTQETT